VLAEWIIGTSAKLKGDAAFEIRGTQKYLCGHVVLGSQISA
jgi:hypothetical protein